MERFDHQRKYDVMGEYGSPSVGLSFVHERQFKSSRTRTFTVKSTNHMGVLERK